MDPIRADQMLQKLKGHSIGGWIIERSLGAGKSAVVFEAEKEGQKVALKVFDPELVDKFGKTTQLKRIEREQNLISESHLNLVQIYGGGECDQTGYLYVAMELLDAPNLASSLTLVPRDKIISIIQQVASATRFLEEKNLAHRDIKPENIAVFPDFSRAVLLDLGVLRPIGDSNLTDDDARVFVGTLRYSSPEYLLRTENDTLEGWRAITFYQLGAVLHDLIMRRPLFNEFSQPFAMLVQAVKSEKPEIHADDVSPDLILLAQNCLVKSPEARLNLVSWNDFNLLSSTRKSADNARERVKKRNLVARTQSMETISSQRLSPKQITERVLESLENIIRNECIGNDSFPPMELKQINDDPIQIIVKFPPSVDHALPQQLSIRFDCELVDEVTAAIHIAASANLSANGISDNNPPETANVFRGPLDSPKLVSRIQDVLWYALDLAQQKGSALGDSVYWLNLVKELEGKK